MNVNSSFDNFNNFNIQVNYSDDGLKTPEKIGQILNDKTTVKIPNIKKYLTDSETVNEMVKKNYNEYKKNKKNINKIYNGWVHPELNTPNDVNLNKCTCKNCGNIVNIVDIDTINLKKETSYF